jgi:hypothetical protein
MDCDLTGPSHHDPSYPPPNIGLTLCRYVQLPINAQMREAWERSWQKVDVEGSAQNKTFMEAAARLGVGVFASAPLLEGKLLQDSQLKVSCSPACCLALVGAKVASRCIAALWPCNVPQAWAAD